MFENENEAGHEMTQEEADIRSELQNEIFGEGQDTIVLPVKEEAASEEGADKVAEKEGEEPGEKPVDPWAGVPDVVKTAIASINEQLGGIGSFENRLKQAENRVGGIDNRLRDMKAAFPAAKHPSKQEVEAALASSKGFKVFQEDFPDHAEAIKEIILATNTGAGQGGGISIEEVEKMREEMNTNFEERLNKQQLAFELKLLRMKHKNHATLVKEPEFMPWLHTQPPETQAKYGSWDAFDGIELLDGYVAHKEAKKKLPNIAAERRERLDTAASAHRSAATIKAKSEADMTEAEYRDHIAKQIWGK